MPGSSEPELLPRFSRGARILHWAHSIPFLFLLLSGLTLFIPSIKAVHIGGYRLVPLLHVIVGIAFILSLIPLVLALPDRQAVLDDCRRLFRLDGTDRPWGLYALTVALGGRALVPALGKFNLGQKLNAIFSVVVTLALMGTGAVLAVNFFTKSVFSARFVEQVFPLHDFFMLIAIPVLAGHIYLGTLNPGTRESLRGIVRGVVRRSWAQQHHALWAREVEERLKADGSADGTDGR